MRQENNHNSKHHYNVNLQSIPETTPKHIQQYQQNNKLAYYPLLALRRTIRMDNKYRLAYNMPVLTNIAQITSTLQHIIPPLRMSQLLSKPEQNIYQQYKNMLKETCSNYNLKRPQKLEKFRINKQYQPKKIRIYIGRSATMTIADNNDNNDHKCQNKQIIAMRKCVQNNQSIESLKYTRNHLTSKCKLSIMNNQISVSILPIQLTQKSITNQQLINNNHQNYIKTGIQKPIIILQHNPVQVQTQNLQSQAHNIQKQQKQQKQGQSHNKNIQYTNINNSNINNINNINNITKNPQKLKHSNNVYQIISTIFKNPKKMFMKDQQNPTRRIANPSVIKIIEDLQSSCKQFLEYCPQYIDEQQFRQIFQMDSQKQQT